MKNKWFWIRGAIVIIILGALGGNIALLVCLRDCQQEQSAWLTLFGGWLGFLATLIVGIIAYWQTNKFTFESKKQNLTTSITSYMRDLQEGFVNFVKADKLVDLNSIELNLCYLESENEITKCELEINDREIELLNNNFIYESILSKAFYCSVDIIEFHKKIIELEGIIEKINYFDGKENHDIKFYIGKHQECQILIKKWINEIFFWVNKIKSDFQNLRNQVLETSNLSEFHNLEKDIVKEENKISEYFQDNSNKRISELKEDIKLGETKNGQIGNEK